jgi:hypothetical protein
MNDKLLMEIGDLIIRSMDHSVTDEEFAHFQELLKTNPTARQYYFDLMATFGGVEEIRSFFDEGYSNASALLKALSDEEKTSPKIILPDPEQPKEPVVRKAVPKFQYIYFEKRYFVQLLLSAAALLLVILMVKLMPSRSESLVATLSGSIDAEWAETSIVLEDGARLAAGSDSLQLRKGVVELQFDNGVSVVVEAPAEFMIRGEDRIKLFYGQLYADVPQRATGFSVHTLNSQIIDLGTAFGVKAEADGASQVHVLEGTVNLVAGSKNEQYSGLVHEGQARRVSGFSSQVSEITCDETRFIRKISPETQVVWRGERRLDLADIASGGNGFGTARPNMGIELNTGKLVAGNSERRGRSNGGYIPVAESAFVDGVFVPTGKNSAVVITSQGHTYSDFGTTNTQLYMTVGAFRTVNMFYAGKNEWQNDVALTLTNREKVNPVILCLHANAGITFDLDAIRESVPLLNVRQFSSEFGIAQTTGTVLSDFYVFVDGQLRMVKKDVSSVNEPLSVSIPLEPSNRFLTLVCTEGTDNYRDWTLFVNPVLEVEPK